MFSSRTPQEVIDTQNHTISNCILNIPQLLKLELSNNVITHKTGSIQTQCGNVYATYTLTQDRSTTISDSLADGLYFVNPSNNGTLTITAQGKFGSGNTLPADGSTYERFFLTTDQKMYHYGSGSWSVSGLNYPVCMIKMTSGVASYAKDSNGNYMVFNGACFIGHHAVIYPNVKGLIPDGIDTNGNLKSDESVSNSLKIMELSGSAIGLYNRYITQTVGSFSPANYKVVDDFDDLETTTQNLFAFVKKGNVVINQKTGAPQNQVPFIKFTLSGMNVTDFVIYQPVRTATVEMLDNLHAQINSEVYHQPQDRTTLFSTWINSGDITLTQPFTDFEYLEIFYTNDSNTEIGVRVISSDLLYLALSMAGYEIFQLIEGFSGAYWKIKSFNSGSTTNLLKYDQDQYIGISHVNGVNRKAA